MGQEGHVEQVGEGLAKGGEKHSYRVVVPRGDPQLQSQPPRLILTSRHATSQGCGALARPRWRVAHLNSRRL